MGVPMLKRSKMIFATRGPNHHFFGYYDKSPLDKTCRKLLCLRTDFNDRIPDENDVAEIGYWDIRKGTYYAVADTRAFNWQQGCMLQWLGPNFDRYIIFNDRRDEQFVSIILDIENGHSEVVPFPVYSVHPMGNCAVSVDFERHYFPRRGYAYAGIVKLEKSKNLVEEDGIYYVDFKSKSSQFIISTREMYQRHHLTSMEAGANYLEHLMFSPSGHRFLFLHRWELEDSGIYTRVYSATPDGSDISCLLDSGKATHYCWRGNRHVLLWGTQPNIIGRLRQYRQMVKTVFRRLVPIYHRLVNDRSRLAQRVICSSYLLLDDAENPNAVRFAPHDLSVDGHPSWNPVMENWMVTDTYPTANSLQWLYLYNEKANQRVEIDAFFTPPGFSDSPWRCDLHPRWDFTGRYICIDLLNQEGRQMYLFDVVSLVSAGQTL